MTRDYLTAKNMETIKKIYKIGLGPSSSHTMGPHRAAEMFAARTKDSAVRYRVTLYGSLPPPARGTIPTRPLPEAWRPRRWRLCGGRMW